MNSWAVIVNHAGARKAFLLPRTAELVADFVVRAVALVREQESIPEEDAANGNVVSVATMSAEEAERFGFEVTDWSDGVPASSQ